MTKKELRKWKGHQEWIPSVAFTANGRELVSCGRDGSITLWDAVTWASTREFSVAPSKAMCVAVSPKGGRLAVGTWDGDLCFYNISIPARTTLREAKRQFIVSSVALWAHDLPISSIAFDSTGSTLASGGLEERVKLWTKLPKFE
jgi:WD40 repeat protein